MEADYIEKDSKINRKRRPSERVCGLSNLNLCEDEIHFLLICPLSRDLRQLLIDHIHNKNHDFFNLSNLEKVVYLMQFCQHELMSFVQNAWKIRSSNS